MKNINPISDHVIACVNDGIWSVKILLDGQTFTFVEVTNEIRSLPRGGAVSVIGVSRNTITAKAMLLAQEAYSKYLASKVVA